MFPCFLFQLSRQTDVNIIKFLPSLRLSSRLQSGKSCSGKYALSWRKLSTGHLHLDRIAIWTNHWRPWKNSLDWSLIQLHVLFLSAHWRSSLSAILLQVSAVVTSADPLSAKELADVAAACKATLEAGKTLKLSQKVRVGVRLLMSFTLCLNWERNTTTQHWNGASFLIPRGWGRGCL